MQEPSGTLRQAGISSRARFLTPNGKSWSAPLGISVPMPIAIDIQERDGLGRLLWQVDVTVDLVGDELSVTHAVFHADNGLDLRKLQLHFRWQTPIDIATHLIPKVIKESGQIENFDLPLDGFPDAVLPGKRIYNNLTDEFLAQIVWHKRQVGKGYAKSLAEARGVPVRTVISWMEKAKRRGLLKK